MFDKIASTEAKYEELMASLGTSQVQSDANEYRKQAKALARDHRLAVALWGTGWYEARMLATFVDDPAEVTAARAKIPSLQHGRRFELIEPMAEPTHLHAVRGPA